MDISVWMFLIFWLILTFLAVFRLILLNICQPFILCKFVIGLLNGARLVWGLQLFLVVVLENAILFFCVILSENLLIIIISLFLNHQIEALVYFSLLVDGWRIVRSILIKNMLLGVIKIVYVATSSTTAFPSYFT